MHSLGHTFIAGPNLNFCLREETGLIGLFILIILHSPLSARLLHHSGPKENSCILWGFSAQERKPVSLVLSILIIFAAPTGHVRLFHQGRNAWIDLITKQACNYVFVCQFLCISSHCLVSTPFACVASNR